MRSLALLLLFAFVNQSIVVGQVKGVRCKSDDDCKSNQCCQILKKYQIMSRDLTSLKRTTYGTCQKYLNEGDICPRLGKINGYCSCGAGLQCTTRQVPINGTVINTNKVSRIEKRKLSPPKPGMKWQTKCEKENMN